MVALTPQSFYKPMNKNLMDKIQSPTACTVNLICVIVGVMASWFAIYSIYVFIMSLVVTGLLSSGFSFINTTDLLQDQMIPTSDLLESFSKNGYGLVVWLLLSGPIIFLFFMEMFRFLPELCSLVGMMVYCLFAIPPLCRLYNDNFDTFDLPAKVYEDILLVVFYVTVYFSFLGNIKRLIDISVRTSRVVLFHPMLFLFGTIAVTMSMTVFVFTAPDLYGLSDSTYSIILLLVRTYLISLILYFTVALICQCVFTWYSSETDEEFAKCSVLTSFVLVSRNQIGSILFNATLILPVIKSIHFPCTSQFPSFPRSGVKTFLSKWWLSSCGLNYALPLITSRGAGVRQSTKVIFYLLGDSLRAIILFCSLFVTILAVFCEATKYISMAMTIAIIRNSAATDLYSTNIAAVYSYLTFYLLGFAFTAIAVGVSVVVFKTTEKVEETLEREMITHNEGIVLEEIVKS